MDALYAMVLADKGLTADDIEDAARVGFVISEAHVRGLGAEALASFIAGLKAGEDVDGAIRRARTDWDF